MVPCSTEGSEVLRAACGSRWTLGLGKPHENRGGDGVKVVKQCAYCGQVYNLLPAIMVTPLYRITTHDRALPLKDYGYAKNPGHLQHSGFRLALKWWRFHLGWEVDFETR
jgi:hypothetical protein